MYSMVLMMALSTGASTPASCHSYSGCYGGNGCAGYACNGYRNGGHGLFGGMFGGHGCNGYGCNGGCHGYVSGCNGCNGGYSHGCCGLFGGLFGRHGCNGGCNGYRNGCYGCAGAGCTGGHPAALPPAEKKPVTPKIPAPGGAPKVEGKEEARVPAPARLLVNVPAEAKLSIDDVVTTSTSATRLFVTPELAPGKDYVYTLKAEISRNGKTETVTKQVTVRAGRTTETTLELPVATASK